jgi:hypothetical protein
VAADAPPSLGAGVDGLLGPWTAPVRGELVTDRRPLRLFPRPNQIRLLGAQDLRCGTLARSHRSFHEPLKVGGGVLPGEVNVPFLYPFDSAEGGVLATLYWE